MSTVINVRRFIPAEPVSAAPHPSQTYGTYGISSSIRWHTLNTAKLRKRVIVSLACGFAAVLVSGCGAGGSVSTNDLQGTVSSTTNPLVAIYTITPIKPGTVAVAFGKTTSYGMQTWTQQTPPSGGPVSIYVAGMQANTLYHMQAVVQYGDGTSFKDADHTFMTGSYAAGVLPQFTASTSPGQTPQPGIEVVNSLTGSTAGIVAVDLAGNVIWAYNPNLTLNGAVWTAPKLLPNGDFIALAAPTSSLAISTAPPSNAANLVREFDLAGNTIKQITMTQLNAALAAAGYDLKLIYFSHDITVLPNGHWLILANTTKSVVLNGQTTPTQVLGDVIVDLDTNLNPVWVWNEFDYLDVNRHPMNFPDWTHTNAVVYSPDDGDLLVSIRHQNWVVKVDYYNGTGSGNILWHLGQGGDFTLIGGTDPTDWNYAQHGISIASPNSSGIFNLALMDNGDDRLYPGETTNELCGTNGAPSCYSTVPIFQINESAKTATLLFHQILPANLYTNWGGNAEVLQNGDVEYDICAVGSGLNSQVVEATNTPDPQTIWTLDVSKSNAYRAYRLPSLYPDVQW